MKTFIRIGLILGLILVGIVSFFIIYFQYGLPWKHSQMKKEMTHYLEERYLDDFTLEKIRFDFIHGKNYFSYATAASTGVNFYVERSGDGDFDDGYGNEHWSSFGNHLIKPYLPKSSNISATVSFDQPLPKNSNVLQYKQHTCWTIHIDFPYGLTESNADMELNDLLVTIQKMDNDHICFEYILVAYMGDYVELQKEDFQQIQKKNMLEIADDDRKK